MNAEEQLIIIRGNWVRIMVLTGKRNVDKHSPEFKRIKKELEYRSKIMERWGFYGEIPEDYKVPPLDDNTNIKY